MATNAENQTAARDTANRRLAQIASGLFRNDDGIPRDLARAYADEIADMAPLTWYACACGPIAPDRRLIDAVCDKCGSIRKLPPRLDFAPWTLYLACLPRIFSDWFPRIARALSAHGLLKSQHDDVLTCIDDMNIHSDATATHLNWIALSMPHMHDLEY